MLGVILIFTVLLVINLLKARKRFQVSSEFESLEEPEVFDTVEPLSGKGSTHRKPKRKAEPKPTPVVQQDVEEPAPATETDIPDLTSPSEARKAFIAGEILNRKYN